MLAGSIADSKLNTISTAGKVSNSATTATNSNTASTIVARDASGNFSAGTITANLTGNVTGDVTGNLTGNASTATTSTTATNIVGGANGSIPYQTASGTTTMLAAGTNGYVLTLSGGVPTWAAAGGGGGGISVSNTPGEGDLVYYSSGNWIARRLTLANTGGGSAISIMQPFLALNYCIATTGLWPSQASENPFIGEIELFAFNYAPVNYAKCDGQILSISSYNSLFFLLGTTYGGNGTTTFGLPDLRGRTPIHQGQGSGLTNRALGASGGAESVTISITNLPSHNHTITYED